MELVQWIWIFLQLACRGSDKCKQALSDKKKKIPLIALAFALRYLPTKLNDA